MKCPSCKYENRYCYKTVDDVIYYKSGKNKGQVKEIKNKTLEFYKDDPEFVEIYTRQRDEFEVKGMNFFRDMETVDLYACPKCGTVIVQQINEDML